VLKLIPGPLQTSVGTYTNEQDIMVKCYGSGNLFDHLAISDVLTMTTLGGETDGTIGTTSAGLGTESASIMPEGMKPGIGSDHGTGTVYGKGWE